MWLSVSLSLSPSPSIRVHTYIHLETSSNQPTNQPTTFHNKICPHYYYCYYYADERKREHGSRCHRRLVVIRTKPYTYVTLEQNPGNFFLTTILLLSLSLSPLSVFGWLCKANYNNFSKVLQQI